MSFPGHAAEPAPAPDAGDWYANLLWLDRRKYLLLTHTATLFSIFEADVRAVDLRATRCLITELIERELRREGLPPATFGDLRSQELILAKTADRRVLGCSGEDSQQLRAPQDHQPIIGVGGAPDAGREAAAACPASVPEGQTAGSILPYRLGMPARNLPTAQDAAAARRVLLDGLAGDSEVSELAGEPAPLHPRNNTFPGEVFLDVAADVLDWCSISRSEPLALEGMRERFLPELAFRGRENKKLQFAFLAAAALRGGTEPDLLDEVAWSQTDDFWAVRPVRGGRLYPRRSWPSRRAGAPRMPGTGAARRPSTRMSLRCAP